MKKKRRLFVSLSLLFIIIASSSSVNDTDTLVGSQAPNFTVNNGERSISLQDERGNYVLVTFWSSLNPDSRITNMEQDRITESSNCIKHLSINYDKSFKVYQEICRLDGLNSDSQFYGSNSEGKKLLIEWRQENGFSSFLIDPQGRIIAVNPSAATLAKI